MGAPFFETQGRQLNTAIPGLRGSLSDRLPPPVAPRRDSLVGFIPPVQKSESKNERDARIKAEQEAARKKQDAIDKARQDLKDRMERIRRERERRERRG